MPNERETPRPSAQPRIQPDPGALLNAMQQVPETLLLAWQQVVAGAPTTWSAQWTLGESRFPGAPQEQVSQEPPSTSRREPPHPDFSRMHGEALDFWIRLPRSFLKGLVVPAREGRS